MPFTVTSQPLDSHAEQIKDLPLEQLLQLAAASFGGTLESRLTGAAIATVVARMVQLNSKDQEYLFECVKDLATIKSREDAEDTLKTIIEILESNNGNVVCQEKLEREAPKAEYESWLVWISQKLRDARERNGMTQQQLAEKSGIPQSHISRLEGGKHSPSHKTLNKLALALGVDSKQFTLED